jgi:hypothetical protein
MFRQPLVNKLVLFVLLLSTRAYGVVPPSAAPKPDVRQLLQKLTQLSPDPCANEPANETDSQPSRIEIPLLETTSDLVTDALNTDNASPAERARRVLEGVENASAEINSSWPKDNQFRFEILDLKEILVVKMSIRVYERFFVFGVPGGDAGKPNRLWRRIGLIEDDSEFDVPWVKVELYPLHRGLSGTARFLARSTMGGCAGSFGIAYDAREWRPEFGGMANQIINVKGALGLDDQVNAFPTIGKLRTDGPVIDLPYCWWSAIDTWDNPSMCAVDRYDLSGNEVRFIARRVNRPDLLPIAKAAKYAEDRDLPAVRAYCTSDVVARRLVESAPSRLFEADVKVKPHGAEHKLVYEDGGGYRFVVVKRGDRWLIENFAVD